MTAPLTEKEELEALESLLGKVQHPTVFPKLAAFGYDNADLTADQALAAAAHTARTNQQKEYAEARAASVQEDQAQAALRSAIVQLHRIVDLAHRKNKTLALPHILAIQPIPKAEAVFLDYATSLLDRLEASPDALAAVAPFGVNAARITAVRTLRTTAHTASQAQDIEQSEAQQATSLYQERIAQVRLARSTLLTLTREACKDDPDLLVMFD